MSETLVLMPAILALACSFVNISVDIFCVSRVGVDLQTLSNARLVGHCQEDCFC